jgi:hypothetical protein
MSTSSSVNPTAASLLGVEPTQADLIMRGVACAVRGDGQLSSTQSRVLAAIGSYVLGAATPPDDADPIAPAQFADALDDETLRRRTVQLMVSLEIIGQPVDPATTARVENYASALHVDEAMLSVARDYAQGAFDVAMGDLFRNSYVGAYSTRHAGELTLHETVAPTSPGGTIDPGLAATWNQLETCPAGSLGRAVWDFYQMRGFAVPGTPGSVAPLLAQHDFLHCLADYGTSALGELEVFTLIASAIPDPIGFSYLVPILGLFETGYQPLVPGVATANPGHLSAPDGPVRFADAMRRGLCVGVDVMGEVDWFEHVDRPIDDVRGNFGVLPKHPDAVAAGSLPALDPRSVFYPASAHGHDPS